MFKLEQYFIKKEISKKMKNLLKKGFLLTLSLTALSCTSTKQNQNAEKDDEVFALAINNAIPAGEIELLDSFEDGNFWQAEEGKNFLYETEVTEDWYSEGSLSGIWSFNSIAKEEEAFFYCDALSDRNWEGAKALIVDINNTTSKTIQLYLKIDSGKRPVEHALTAPLALGSGINTNVYFDLEHFLTDSDLNPILKIQEDSNVRKLTFVIKGKTKSGAICVDNIRLVR